MGILSGAVSAPVMAYHTRPARDSCQPQTFCSAGRGRENFESAVKELEPVPCMASELEREVAELEAMANRELETVTYLGDPYFDDPLRESTSECWSNEKRWPIDTDTDSSEADLSENKESFCSKYRAPCLLTETARLDVREKGDYRNGSDQEAKLTAHGNHYIKGLQSEISYSQVPGRLVSLPTDDAEFCPFSGVTYEDSDSYTISGGNSICDTLYFADQEDANSFHSWTSGCKPFVAHLYLPNTKCSKLESENDIALSVPTAIKTPKSSVLTPSIASPTTASNGSMQEAFGGCNSYADCSTQIVEGKRKPKKAVAPTSSQNKKRTSNSIVRSQSGHSPTVCYQCRTQSTPVWRAGPDGPKTLCNACGVRYMKISRKKL